MREFKIVKSVSILNEGKSFKNLFAEGKKYDASTKEMRA